MTLSLFFWGCRLGRGVFWGRISPVSSSPVVFKRVVFGTPSDLFRNPALTPFRARHFHPADLSDSGDTWPATDTHYYLGYNDHVDLIYCPLIHLPLVLTSNYIPVTQLLSIKREAPVTGRNLSKSGAGYRDQIVWISSLTQNVQNFTFQIIMKNQMENSIWCTKLQKSPRASVDYFEHRKKNMATVVYTAEWSTKEVIRWCNWIYLTFSLLYSHLAGKKWRS